MRSPGWVRMTWCHEIKTDDIGHQRRIKKKGCTDSVTLVWMHCVSLPDANSDQIILEDIISPSLRDFGSSFYRTQALADCMRQMFLFCLNCPMKTGRRPKISMEMTFQTLMDRYHIVSLASQMYVNHCVYALESWMCHADQNCVYRVCTMDNA